MTLTRVKEGVYWRIRMPNECIRSEVVTNFVGRLSKGINLSHSSTSLLASSLTYPEQ